MSFQALARTWRPRRFEDIVGQTHVTRALAYALDANRLHHALLFSGTRGVGKTTLARIVAKCLNCEAGVTCHPCAAADASPCASCREIDAGRFVDLIEVDAASRTGVEDTRALMDNVAYAPTHGRTKVYLIDEVHMLSKHSFNALLKTFEEPPPSVQFILATTEPEKIPVTILSRCLQFSLKRLPSAQIADQLNRVARSESLTVAPEAVDEIARAADGSMRDGLSLLDQGLAYGGGALASADVRAMLGTIGTKQLATLVDAVVDAAPGQAMQALDALYADGVDAGALLEALATAWQSIATVQIVGEAIDTEGERWRETAARAEAAAVQVFYDITLAGIRDLTYAPDPLVGTRMTILRMLAFAPAETDTPDNVSPADDEQSTDPPNAQLGNTSASKRAPNARAETATIGDGQPAAAEATKSVASCESEASAALGTPSRLAPDATATPANSADPAQEPLADWHALATRLPVTGLTAQLVANAACDRIDGEGVALTLSCAQSFLLTDKTRTELTEALSQVWGEQGTPKLQVHLVDQTGETPAQRREKRAEQRQSDAVAAIENDPIVNKLKQRLGAQVRLESIKPTR